MFSRSSLGERHMILTAAPCPRRIIAIAGVVGAAAARASAGAAAAAAAAAGG